LLVETLRPITARFTGLLDDREALDAILARGAAKARQIAGPTLEATYQALGLLRG
jgi:tryptophanyl-tRNA synthetase